MYTYHSACVDVSRQLLGAMGPKDRAQVARLGSEHLTLATSEDGGRLSSLHSGEPQVQLKGT